MPAPINTLLIDGSFPELADELAQYIDDLKKKHGVESSALKAEISQLLEKKQQDEVLKKLVTASSVLNAAPEKEFVPAYNLLVHLVRQAPKPEMFYERICTNVSAPITSSPANAPGLALSVLTTVFNIVEKDNEVRYHIFLAIIRVIKRNVSFELLKPQLKNLDSWISLWETDEEDQQELYLLISATADDAGEKQQAYLYLLRALKTIPTKEVNSKEAKELSIRALKSALSDPLHFDFQDLTALDSIQALRKSEPVFFELLEIFSADQLDEFNDFREEHEGWVEKQGLEPSVLHRKMRLLTLASLAASTQSRSLPYQHISRALQVRAEDVEMWVIDVIRAGLVEGKLSQLNQTFLIHRSTYRVFGEKQWTEVSGRLDTWRSSLEGVLAIVRQEREKMIREKERELKDIEGKLNGPSGGGGGGGGGRRPQREIDTSMD